MKIVFQPKITEEVLSLPRSGTYLTNRVCAQIQYTLNDDGYITLSIDGQSFGKSDVRDLIEFLQAVPFD